MLLVFPLRLLVVLADSLMLVKVLRLDCLAGGGGVGARLLLLIGFRRVLCLCLEEVGGVGTNPSLFVLEDPACCCFCLSLSRFLLPRTRDLLVVGARARAGVTATTPPLLAGKLAKLGELAELPGALGTGVGVTRGTADLRVVTGGPRGVVTVCFCNRELPILLQQLFVKRNCSF